MVYCNDTSEKKLRASITNSGFYLSQEILINYEIQQFIIRNHNLSLKGLGNQRKALKLPHKRASGPPVTSPPFMFDSPWITHTINSTSQVFSIFKSQPVGPISTKIDDTCWSSKHTKSFPVTGSSGWLVVSLKHLHQDMYSSKQKKKYASYKFRPIKSKTVTSISLQSLDMDHSN